MWIWQLPDWPNFNYNSSKIMGLERQFLQKTGQASIILNYIDVDDRNKFLVEIISNEALKSAEIEGEMLQRESLQSSIKKHFGLTTKDAHKKHLKEYGMANLVCHVYDTYQQSLTHKMLYDWHQMLMSINQSRIEVGKYRRHAEAMQIVSARSDTVFYEAPPSEDVYKEMDDFIIWFNEYKSESILAKAAIGHLYFECIHPFEDGNGRIGRVLVEKALSTMLGYPTLISISSIIEKNKKAYYEALGKCNKSLDVDEWIVYFANVITDAQIESVKLIEFLMYKSKLMSSLQGKINARQEKALLRIFKEGPGGFSGGLSADNYIAITKTSKATATRDLAELVEMNVLRKTGQLKHTRYWLVFP